MRLGRGVERSAETLQVGLDRELALASYLISVTVGGSGRRPLTVLRVDEGITWPR